MRVGIIGPTDVSTLSMFLGMKKEDVLSKAARVGEEIAKAGHELWVNPDGGMLAAVAEAYKAAGGKNHILLFPADQDPWPNEHARPYRDTADDVQERPDWFRTNHAVVSEVDICICVGFSAGTFTELGYVKWDEEFHRGRLRRLVVVRELARGGRLPPEYSAKFRDILRYVDTVEGLPPLLREEVVQEPLSLT